MTFYEIVSGLMWLAWIAIGLLFVWWCVKQMFR